MFRTIDGPTFDMKEVGMSSLKINTGLDKKFWPALIEFSRTDPLVSRFTGDPTRFANEHTLRQWLKKGRYCYTVTTFNDALVGLFWFGKKDIPISDHVLSELIEPSKYPYTIASRIYPPLRGTGNGTAIKRQIYNQIVRSALFTSSPGGFWSETTADNEANIRTNLKLGYRIISIPNTANKILMVANNLNLTSVV